MNVFNSNHDFVNHVNHDFHFELNTAIILDALDLPVLPIICCQNEKLVEIPPCQVIQICPTHSTVSLPHS